MEVISPKFFKNGAAFRSWLKKNHAKEKEVWVGYWKVHTGKPSMTWSESVDEALCFGWIDGIRKRIDDDSYTNRFTPRRPGSNWSEINIEKVELLKKKGLMHPAGMAVYQQKDKGKLKLYSYEEAPGKLSTGYQRLFKANKTAWKFFNEQSPTYKRTMIHWIMSAKQEATRMKRLSRTIEVSENGKRM